MPVTPSPASTLALLRPRAALEVLLIQRHPGSRFAGGDFVFPGGKVEPGDTPDDALAWCRAIGAANLVHCRNASTVAWTVPGRRTKQLPPEQVAARLAGTGR